MTYLRAKSLFSFLGCSLGRWAALSSLLAGLASRSGPAWRGLGLCELVDASRVEKRFLKAGPNQSQPPLGGSEPSGARLRSSRIPRISIIFNGFLGDLGFLGFLGVPGFPRIS